MSADGHKGWDLTNEADLLEFAWAIIANAQGGDWDAARPEWKEAAEQWRNSYHAWLGKYLDDKKKQTEGGL